MKYLSTNNNLKEIKIILLWYYVGIATTSMHIYGGSSALISLPKGVEVPALLVFGDSIVDPGNNNYINTIAKANHPPYGRDFPGGVATGRYSNGRVPSDLIAEDLGIKEFVPAYLDPTLTIDDLLTGVSFAFGAAGFDPESAQSATTLSLDDQLNFFKEYINKLKAAVGENQTSSIISQSFYLVCAGSNDITNTYFTLPFRRLHYDISAYTAMMADWASTFVKEIYELGGRRIGVISAPPCGCLPSQRTIHGGLSRECSQDLNQASTLYNNKLSSELDLLNQQLIGSRIVYLDIYTPLMYIIDNPNQAGFEVSNKGCCGTGEIEVTFLCTNDDPFGVCPDASKYVFWDSFHPTEAGYNFIVTDIVAKDFSRFF